MSAPKKYRTVIKYKTYFEDFIAKQRPKVREKIIWTFLLIEEIQQIPESYLKHLEGQTDYMKSVFNWEAIFSESFASSTKVNWLYWQMDFKRKLKKRLNKK